MKPVCVLGNGQLGRMLRQAGEPLGIAVYPVGLDAEPEAVPYQKSIITAEIERWPETALTNELEHHANFINRDIFPLLADRLPQKQLLDELHLATAPWQPLTLAEQWPELFNQLGSLLSLNAVLVVTTDEVNGGYTQVTNNNYQPKYMVNVLSNKVFLSLEKSL